MNYLQALKTARDYFGMDAMAIRGDEISPLSELIEQAEAAPTAADSPDDDVRLDTAGQLITAEGVRITAWAISEADEGGNHASSDGDPEPMLIVVSGKDLPG